MLEVIDHAAIRELRLARPPVNALDPGLVAALEQAVAAAPAAGARALVISGQPGLYSAGLDIRALLALDANGITAFWAAFFQLLGTVAASPIPVVAAITGHSPAGGAVLSLYCDYRVMARGDFRIGLNEVQVGLSVPPQVQQALRRLVGAHRAERLLVEGAMIDPIQAHAIGLVDALTDPAEVVPHALAWCERHLALPAEALARTRALARQDLIDATRADLDPAGMTAVWFGEETQTTLRKQFLKAKG